ncbi:MAG: glycosyltransferase [Bacteroides sp.]|nr:glycosyltransferase [Bacteroides sp.]MCM1390170.1 glycosyltransferase [Bacteroides sp.]
MTTPSQLISIVIPVYNRAHIIERTLDSIYNQDTRPINLILVDNNSSDNSLEVISRWKERHHSKDFDITITSENTIQSASAARNKGLSLVKTPYVMFFDSDDIMRPNHISRAARAFNDDPELDIAGWDVMFHALDGSTSIRPFADKDIVFRHTFNATLATQRYAASTSLVRAAGGWNPTVLGWDDYELGMRLLGKNPKLMRLGDEITVDVMESKESITGTDYSSRSTQWEYALDIAEKHFRKNNWNISWINLRRVILAALYAREHSPESSRLLKETLTHEPLPIKRALYRLAYTYTKLGGRGIHLLVRGFL